MVDTIIRDLQNYPIDAKVTCELVAKHCGFTTRVLHQMFRSIGELTPLRRVWASRIKALGTEDPVAVIEAIRKHGWNNAARTGFQDAYGYPLPRIRWKATQAQLAKLEEVAKTTKTISGQARELKLKEYQIRLLWKLNSRTQLTQ
jgi:methylphosphotriester-DNA--protein-cysteine methyltransferase